VVGGGLQIVFHGSMGYARWRAVFFHGSMGYARWREYFCAEDLALHPSYVLPAAAARWRYLGGVEMGMQVEL